MSNEVKYIIRPYTNYSINVRELWEFRELFYFFTWRDIKVRYKQTFLGIFWVIIQPLLLVGIFTFFFSNKLQVPTDGIPPILFYFSGLLYWNLFSSGLNSAGNSLIINAPMLKKIYFPRLIIPISCVLVTVVDFIVAWIIFFLLNVYFHINNNEFNINLLMLLFISLLALLITIGTTIGIGILIAAFSVKYRDFKYLLPFALQFLLFVTPVIYPISILNDYSTVKYLLATNPMTTVIHLGRSVYETTNIDWTIIIIGIASMFAYLLLGLYAFKKTEAYFADIA